MLISSVSNPKIKELVKLLVKKDRDETKLFLVEGEHLVNEALKSGYLKEVILLEGNIFNGFELITHVTSNVMAKLSKQKSIPKIIGVCQKKETKQINGNVLLLDEIQDPGNLGSIIRSAVAFNIDTIILSPECVDLYNEKVIRSTEGLIFQINVIIEPLTKSILELKRNNYTVIASTVTKSKKVSKIQSKYALIIGNEGQGIKQNLIELSDEIMNIEINEKVESLNAGVATGILLYELNRR